MRRRPPPPPQPHRGGRRAGAGRPRVRPLPEGWRQGRRFVPHLRRAPIDARRPGHVTVRLRRVDRTLRNGRSHRTVRDALRTVAGRAGFRVVHYSLQADHLHLVVEAADRLRLARGMQALGISLARRLNRLLQRRGPVLADRYHVRVLATPTEVRRALLSHHRSHRVTGAPSGLKQEKRVVASPQHLPSWRAVVFQVPPECGDCKTGVLHGWSFG
jgi:REP element-mobilizing transposase RayT